MEFLHIENLNKFLQKLKALLHNENLMELLHSESFWVAAAFLIFVALSFKKGKQIIIKTLDKRIENIVRRINEVKEIKKEAENNLNESKKNLEEMIKDKKRIINEANEEAKNLKDKLLNEEKIYSERFKKKIFDRVEQSKNQTINDIKKLALNISIKSVKELLNDKKEIENDELISKSITNLFNKSKKELKDYKELWVPSQNGDSLVCLHSQK